MNFTGGRAGWGTLFNRLFLAWVFAVAVFAGCKLMRGPNAQLSMDELADTARSLFAAEEGYFQKRHAGDWEAMYNYQHPDFRKEISFNEFLYFDGRVPYRQHSTHYFHVSGMTQGLEEFFSKNTEKKDPFGFPAPRTYHFVPNPNFRLENHAIEKIELSEDGLRAKTHMRIRGTALFPPEVWRGIQEIKMDEVLLDYWEKVDGKWYITLLRSSVTVSGATDKFYMLPDDGELWNNIRFIEVPMDRIRPDGNSRKD